MGDTAIITAHKYAKTQQLVTSLTEMRRAEVLCDVTLAVDDVTVPCHKLILAASSPYFKAMFTGGMVESHQHEVQVKGLSSSVLPDIINFVYTDDVEVHNDNVQDLFIAAHLLQLEELCLTCSQHMQHNLDLDNCVHLYRFANLHDSYALLNTARSFILQHFKHVVTTSEFVELSYLELHDILSDDELNIDNEKIAFEAVIKWVNHDKTNRKRYSQELLKDVRLALIDPAVMNELLVSLEEFNNGALLSLCASVDLNSNCSSSPELPDDVRLRTGMYEHEMLVFAGGGQTTKHSRSLACYDPLTNHNYFAIPPHSAFDYKYRIDHHRLVVTDDNDMFMLGGICFDDYRLERNSSSSALKDMQWFDPFARRWVHKAPMLQPRCAHAAVVCNGLVYAIGGVAKANDQPMSSVERYDVTSDEWSYVTSLPHGLSHHNAVACNGSIYVIGGTNGAHVTGNVYQLNVTTSGCSCWTQIARIERPRAEFAMTLVEDVIFIIGGQDDTQKLCEVEMFSLKTMTSRYSVDFPEARKSMAAVTFRGQVYVCGGTRTVISRINRAPRVVDARDLHRWNADDREWVREAKLVQYVNNFGCAVGKINLRRVTESAFVSSN